MKIINIIESQNGSIQHITSFCIHEEQLSEDVVEAAEDEFRKILKAKFDIDEEFTDTYIEDGWFEDKDTSYLLSITWSDVIC